MIEEVTALNSTSRLLQDQMVLEINEFQMGPKQVVFVIWDGQQNVVFDWPTAGIGPFARSQWCCNLDCRRLADIR